MICKVFSFSWCVKKHGTFDYLDSFKAI
jgi:hypothetical protein